MQGLTRRRTLGLCGAAAVAGLAGCSSSSAEESDPDVGSITVENLNDARHTVDVLIEVNGEIEHWTTHDLDPEEAGVDLRPEWPAEVSDFRLTVRLDGDELAQFDVEDDVECLNLVILVDREGQLSILTDSNGECA